MDRLYSGEMFQVMPPRGGISNGYHRYGVRYLFQVMPPRGGILPVVNLLSFCSRFQVMPPRGGILLGLVVFYIPKTGFKSCPREGAS